MDEARFRRVVREAQTVLHGDIDDNGCERACYECLLSFYNQSEHELLDRTLVESWLGSMLSMTLTQVAEARENRDDERFNELLEACESSFERDVLHAIREGEFELPDSAQHVIYDGNEPVAKPDFFYEREGRSVAVFVDGPYHQKDYVKKDEEGKRRRLKNMGYRVIPITDVSQVKEFGKTI